jgi:hypothetical protein
MLSRPNTTVLFPIFKPSSNKLSDSPSPFITPAQKNLYPGDLPEALALLGYEGPDQRIISRNHSTVNISPDDIKSKLEDYIDVTDLLGIPRNDLINQCGTVLRVLGYEIDTNIFILRVPQDKVYLGIIPHFRLYQSPL